MLPPSGRVACASVRTPRLYRASISKLEIPPCVARTLVDHVNDLIIELGTRKQVLDERLLARLQPLVFVHRQHDSGIDTAMRDDLRALGSGFAHQFGEPRLGL